MLMQGISNLAFVGLSFWLAYREFGVDMFYENTFWFLVLVWAYISFTMFLTKWDDLAKKDTDDRIDELITEIRKDRESREKGG